MEEKYGERNCFREYGKKCDIVVIKIVVCVDTKDDGKDKCDNCDNYDNNDDIYIADVKTLKTRNQVKFKKSDNDR